MRFRYPALGAVLLYLILLGLSLGLGGCSGERVFDSQTLLSASTSAAPTTVIVPEQPVTEYVTVLHPYHNDFLDAPSYLIPDSISLARPLPDFPEVIPAQRIVSETLPDTDLRLEPKPAAAGHYFSFGPNADLTTSNVTLSSQDVAVEVARGFLEEHGLWDEGYSAPQVSVGSSVGGPDGTAITSWLVRFDREQVAAGLERYVSVRVGGNDEVIQLSLAIPRLEPLEGKLVRLRPIAEVVADMKAWQMGESAELQNEIQGEVAVEIRDALLAYEDPGSGDEPIAVPVYRFEVEVCCPSGDVKTGLWSVVAAADVVSDPGKLGTVVAP